MTHHWSPLSRHENYLPQTLLRSPRLIGAAFDILYLLTLGQLWPVSAAATIIESEQQLLVVERSDGLGQCLPGGWLHWGETFESAAVRETLEETGLQVSLTRLVGLYPTVDPRLKGNVAVYAGTILTGRSTASIEGQLKWIPLTDGLIQLAFNQGQAIRDYVDWFSSRDNGVIRSNV